MIHTGGPLADQRFQLLKATRSWHFEIGEHAMDVIGVTGCE